MTFCYSVQGNDSDFDDVNFMQFETTKTKISFI